MSVKTRLKRIEQQRRHKKSQSRRVERSEEDWLDWFTAHGKQGAFDHEPDFPTALAVYRKAIEEAKRNNERAKKYWTRATALEESWKQKTNSPKCPLNTMMKAVY